MKFLKEVASLFRFTPNERRGISVLLLLILIVLGIRLIGPRIMLHRINNDPSFKIKTTLIEPAEKIVKKPAYPETDILTIDTNLVIDINDCSYGQLIKIGFSEFTASNVIKYRNSGGRFYEFADLGKIYGVDQGFLIKIKDQIHIKPQPEIQQITQQPKLLLELNSVDSILIQKIPCIGPVRGKRIIKYRETLGGFYDINQVKNIYGIDSLCFINIKSCSWVDVSKVNKISLNNSNEKELAEHPLISRYQARSIVKYRELVAEFEQLSELKSNFIFTENEFGKVENYLSLSR